MRRTLNILGGVLLVLLLGLRQRFSALMERRSQDGGGGQRIRGLLGPTMAVFLVFIALSVWALLAGGYPIVAALLVIHLALLLGVMRRGGRPRSSESASTR